jgi:hypothetical protein
MQTSKISVAFSQAISYYSLHWHVRHLERADGRLPSVCLTPKSMKIYVGFIAFILRISLDYLLVLTMPAVEVLLESSDEEEGKGVVGHD